MPAWIIPVLVFLFFLSRELQVFSPKSIYESAGDNVLSSIVGDLILGGVGKTSRNLTFDKDHQLASAGLMLVPSLDRFLGVADLILCDGDEWKDKVKVCLELFSTASTSERVAPEMERNSLQANNCSFGYVEFNLSQVSAYNICTLNVW